MEGKKTKIPIALKTTLGFAYLNSANHQLLFMKSKILKKELEKLQKKKTKSNVDEMANHQFQELIRIEILTNTVHYAEIFASILLGMSKYKAFHKFLLDYNVNEIIDFYTNIPKRKPQYIAKILQYPYPNKYVDKRLHADLNSTINDARKELKELAKFYLSFRVFYNSYKHGFRLLTTWPEDDFKSILTWYFHESDKLNSGKAIRTIDHVDSALSLCEFIFRFLENAEDHFSQRHMQKKNELTINLWRKRTSSN